MSRDNIEIAPLGPRTAHLCVDMQRMFLEKTDWHTPWMKRVLPFVVRLASAHPQRTIFTRFLPPHQPRERFGTWQPYFERWRTMTREFLDPAMLDLVPELAAYAQAPRIIDKAAYSPFHETPLLNLLRTMGTDTLVISGAETDVCVSAAVFAAMDHGFRIVLARDALCGSADETHDALMKVYEDRFSQQVELATVDEIRAAWNSRVHDASR